MSRMIKFTEEALGDLRRGFEDALKNVDPQTGCVNYTGEIGTSKRRASLVFTEKAYIKMLALVRGFATEVGWHGLAKRGDDPAKDEYVIYDILIYPQEVTGGSITPDQIKYQTWLYEQDDEVFNNIRMQGHSHVNFSVTPSGIDEKFYRELLGQLEDDMFYILLIWNKRDERTVKIFDFAKNIFFDTHDVDISVEDGSIGLNAFMSEAKNVVSEYKPVAKKPDIVPAAQKRDVVSEYAKSPTVASKRRVKTAANIINDDSDRNLAYSDSYTPDVYRYGVYGTMCDSLWEED